jgi:Fungal protein kinase
MPFMAIALLYGDTIHKPVYDLESLFNVLLVICTHLSVFGDPHKNHGLEWKQPTRVAQWFEIQSFRTLADLKAGQFTSIESLIFSDISQPFKVLLPYLSALFLVLFPPRTPEIRTLKRWHSTATCQEFIEVLDRALLDQAIVDGARYRHHSASTSRADPNNRKRYATAATDIDERPMTRSRSSCSSVQTSACSAQSGRSLRKSGRH